MNSQTDLAVRPSADVPMTGAQMKDRVAIVQDVMNTVMKKDVHFGVIPGTKMPTIYKAGMEVLLMAFHIAVEPEVIDLSTEDEIRYVVKCKGIHIPTGQVIGIGVGECSSNEEKYRWRRAVCQEEWDEAPESRRRNKWRRWKDRGGNWHTEKVQQVRTEPADQANTVLKIAKKRAQGDLTLTALGASDRFAVDLEDMTPEQREAAGFSGANVQQPQARQGQPKGGAAPPPAAGSTPPPADQPPTGAVSEKQSKMLYAKLANREIPVDAFLEAFSIDKLGNLPKQTMNMALEWIEAGGAFPTQTGS